MRVLKALLLTVLAAVAVGVVYLLLHFGLRLNSALALVQESAAFQVLQPDARLNVLVVGDDSGVGTGAVLPSESVAGLIAQHYPCASVVNRARDGATTKDVTTQIEGTGNTHFDLLLVQVGANDILRFTKLDDLEHAIGEALNRASARAEHVVFLSSVSLAAAPIIPPFLDSVYDRRSREARRSFIEAADAAGVEYVDLHEQAATGPFANDPREYYASDCLHPDGQGYALWYKALITQSRIESVLEC